jgi:hypothetical protein
MIRMTWEPSSYRRYLTAINRLIRKATIEKNDLPMRSAVDYIYRVSSNISTQRFAGQWSPLNQRYKEWKLFAFGESRWWIMSGALQKSLSAFRLQGGWFGGVPENATAPGTSWFGTDPGSPVSIAEYGYWAEYGRRGQAARPLFNPTLDEFVEEGWPRQADMTIAKLAAAWR